MLATRAKFAAHTVIFVTAVGVVAHAAMRVQRVGLLELARSGSVGEIQAALRGGVPVDSSDSSGVTALHVAAAACRPDVVTLLFAAGSRPDSSARDGSTPLMLAALQGCESVARQLVAAGAKKDLLNARGQTAYSIAVERDHKGIAALVAHSDGLTDEVRATLRSSCPALVRFLDTLVERGLPPLSDDRARRIEQPSMILGAEQPVVFLEDADQIQILFRNLTTDRLARFLSGCAGVIAGRLRDENNGQSASLLGPTGTVLGYLSVSPRQRILDDHKQEWLVGKSTLTVRFERPITGGR